MKRSSSRPRSLTRVALSVLILSTSIATRLEAAPKLPQVTHGSATFQQNGDVLRITAGNGSVINYKSFDIGKGETVQFIQPNSSSRVMNRVTSEDPSKIFGSLIANGTVYLVNPNGIYFANGSMINVGQLYAAAGHLSDTNFLRGQNAFTGLSGDVQNAGQITATNGVAMMGQHVANFGSVISEKGTVAMVAGSDVLVGKESGHIFVRASGPAVRKAVAANAATPGVENAGTVQAPRALMGAGDLYSVALSNTGAIRARDIVLQGGKAGAVNVSGTLDASSAAPATTGGNITVTGKKIALQGATLNASGTAGGGTVKIGGGFQGKGTTPHAATTTVDATSTITANATVSGHGGNVVVWSDQNTQHAGAISATGAGSGHGGSAEVSSKGSLTYEGTADLTAPVGKTGTLLLDPANILVATGGGGTIPVSGIVSGGTSNVTISPTTLVNALKTADVVFVASDSIAFQNGFDSTGNALSHDLTLQAVNTISFGLGGTAVTLALKGSLFASTSANSGLIGTVTNSLIDTSSVNGNITITQGGTGANLNLYSLNAGTGTVYLRTSGTGMQTSGAITAGALGVSGAAAYTITSGTNAVGTFASDATGGVTFTNGAGLNIGTAVSGLGDVVVGLSGGSVTVNSGALTISKAVSLPANATLVLNNTGSSQTATISGGTLVLKGSGTQTLVNANNDFNTLAASTSGSFSFRDKDGLAIGSSPSATGITANQGASIQTGGLLTINQNIATTGSGDLILNTAGATEAATAAITGRSLLIQGTGTFSLATSNANDVGTIAANNNGAISFKDVNGLTVGTVNGINGITSSGKDVILTAVGITVSKDINVGTADLGLLAGTGTLDTSAAALTAGGLGVTATTAPTFGTLNGVSRLAANVANGQFSFISNTALTIDTVAGINGITSHGNAGAITLNGDLIVAADINANGGQISLEALQGSVQQTAGVLTGTTLNLYGRDFVLVTGKNKVDSVSGAAISGAFTVYNDKDLGVGEITANGDVGIGANGNLQLTDTINSGTVVRLLSSGDLKQTDNAIITATTLGVRNVSTTSGDVVLTASNAVTNFAGASAAAGKQLVFLNFKDLTLASASGASNGNFNFAGVNGLAGSGTLGLTANGKVTLTQPITAPNGTVYLQSQTGLSQSGSGTIEAGKLGVFNLGPSLTLQLANKLGTFAVYNAAGGPIFVNSSNPGTTTIGSVDNFSAGNFNFSGISGIQTGFGNVDVATAGALELNGTITAPGSTVRFLTNGGISQTGGFILAASLGARNSGSGDISFSGSNLVFNFVGIANGAAGGSVAYKSAFGGGLFVGSVGAESIPGFNFAQVDGVSTTAGGGGSNTVSLTSATSLSLVANVTAPGSDVLLSAGGSIFETAGAVFANGLALVAGALPVQSGADQINVLAANISGGGGTFTWSNNGALTIGKVLNLVDGITYGGPVTLITHSGDLTLASDVRAAGTVVLDAEVGGVIETTGAVKMSPGGSLFVTAANTSTLTGANSVSNLAARVFSAGDFSYYNVGALQISTVNGVDGVVANGNINLQSGGTLALNNQVGNGGTVRLVAAGQISQNSQGIITANTLGVRAPSVQLLQENFISQVSGTVGASQSIRVQNFGGNDLAVVKLGALTLGNFSYGATNGLTAGTLGEISLFNPKGGFVLQAPITATGARVNLVGFGDFSQDGNGGIAAGTLILRNENGSTGDIIFSGDNNILNLAAYNAASAGSIIVNSSLGTNLNIASVPQFDPGITIGSTVGVTVAGTGDIGLGSGGSITIANPIVATSGTVRLISAGDVTIIGNGSIQATNLGARNLSAPANTGSLQFTNNVFVSNFAADNAAPGGDVYFVEALPGALQLGTVGLLKSGTFDFQQTSGVHITGAGTIGLQSNSSLELNSSLTTGATGRVLLVANGSITQDLGTKITTGTLGALNKSDSTGDILLTNSNSFGTLFGKNLAVGNQFVAVTDQALALGSTTNILKGGFIFTATNGVASTDGNLGLQSGGSLTVGQDISAGIGTVRLVANGAVDQTSGVITAGSLGVRQGSNSATANITLTGLNKIGGDIAAFNAGAGATTSISTAGNLQVGSVGALAYGAFSFSPATTGIATSGTITLKSNAGALTVGGAITSGGGDVNLTSDANTTVQATIDTGGGKATLTSAGALVLGAALTTSGGDAILSATMGDLTTNATISTGGGQAQLTASSGNIFQNGLISAGAGTATLQATNGDVVVNGGITSGGVALTSTTDNVTINSLVAAGAGDVIITAAKAASEIGGGVITAGGLLVNTSGIVTLTNTGNDVQRVAANVTGAGSTFNYVDANGITVGTVGGFDGIVTNMGSVTLRALTQDLSIQKDITATAAVVTLIANTGTVTEDNSVIITADGLAIQSALAPVFNANNIITHLAASVTGAGEKFAFTNTGNLIIDTVGVYSGITTNNGDIALTADGGSLNLRNSVSAGTANVALTAAKGGIFEQGAKTTITGTTLTVLAKSGIALGGKNVVESLDATNTESGSLTFNNTAAQLDLLNLKQSGTSAALVSTAGDIRILGEIAVPLAKTTLLAGTGAISEGAAAKVTARSLTTQAANGVVLTHDITVTDFGATNTLSGNVVLQNTGALNLTGVSNEGGNVRILARNGTLSSAGDVLAKGSLLLTSDGDQSLDGDLSAGAELTLTTRGPSASIQVGGTIDATGAFKVVTNGSTTLDGATTAATINLVGTNIAANDLQATSGDLVVQTPGSVFLTGTTYSGSNVSFNLAPTTPRTQTINSSIVLTNPGLVTISTGGAFAVGYLEKLVANGSLTINAGTATLGDTAARGALIVTAGQIILMDRQPNSVNVGERPDRGLSIVADSIDFGGQSVTLTGQGNGHAFFSVSNGLPNVARTPGVTFYIDADISSQFATTTATSPDPVGNGVLATLPIQPVAGGVVDSQVVAALAGALPEQKRFEDAQEQKLSASTIAKLLSLGVTARDPDDEEKKGIKSKKAIYKQLLGKRNPTDEDYKVVVNRIGPAQVSRVLEKYDRIFGPQQELKPRIEEIFKGQYEKYVEKTGALDAGGFGAYLAEQSAKDSDAKNAMAVVGQFRELFGDLGKIGFTPKEIQIAEDVIARSLNIEGLSSVDFLNLVGVPRKSSAVGEPGQAPAVGAGDLPPGAGPGPMPIPNFVPETPGATPAAPEEAPAPLAPPDFSAPPESAPSIPATPTPTPGNLPPLPPESPSTPGVPAGPGVPNAV